MEEWLTHNIGALPGVSDTYMFTPAHRFYTDFNLNKFLTGQVSEISIRKDLLIYIVDVIRNADLISSIVHNEDTKNSQATTYQKCRVS